MDVSTVLEQFNPEKLEEEKKKLEETLATAHKTGENISQLSADLTYFSTLLDLVKKLQKEKDRFEQAEEIVRSEKEAQLLEMGEAEKTEALQNAEEIKEEIYRLKVERDFTDPDDDKSVIIEVRAGAGGEEAALFAADIFRMYSTFSTKMGWNVEVIDSSVSENGGYKEVVANIKGNNVYKHMKHESGVHRVQRIPTTESSGRIHTSTASVAILPEAKDIEIEIDPAELKIDVMRASGPGGQSVNKTDSAVRITHLPSGIVVSCRETKYQHQNKEKAMQILRARLYEKKKSETDAKRAGMRSSQIGSGMRSEKIRTYNFPQSRITDHRIKKSWFDVDSAMQGDIGEMIKEVGEEILKLQIAESTK